LNLILYKIQSQANVVRAC